MRYSCALRGNFLKPMNYEDVARVLDHAIARKHRLIPAQEFVDDFSIVEKNQCLVERCSRNSREAAQHFVDLAVSTVNQEGAEVLGGYASARIDP